MSGRWGVSTLNDCYGQPPEESEYPRYCVYDVGEDDPPLCVTDYRDQADLIAEALNAFEAARVPAETILSAGDGMGTIAF